MDDVTALLAKWRRGDKSALDALVPLVYEELRRVAHARLRGERPGHQLQTTALVHEAYLRLIDVDRMVVDSRTHFFALAARLMRQVLVDSARRERADKRGGGATMLTLDQVRSAGVSPNVVDVLALDAALDDLAALDERLCRVVELKYFAGLTIDEAAAALNVAAATVERDWAVAKAWLYARFSAQ
jgi:RNA polymerase sigma factor (TIGR02999 family)